MADGKIDTTFNNPLGYNILDTLPNNLVVLSTDGSIIKDNLGKIFNVNTVFDINTNEIYLMITRYTNSGILDTGFGTNGYILDRFLNTHTWAKDAIIDSNNNILIVGFLGQEIRSDNTKLFVARYTNSGVLDTKFNSPTGYNIIDFGLGIRTIGNSLGIDNLGNIVVGGSYLVTNPTVISFILAKYDSNGILVNGFGTSGYSIDQINNSNTVLQSLVIDDNNILITGALYGISKTYIAKYTSNGVIDTSFNNPTGYVIPDNTNCEGRSITIDNSGKIVVCSISFNAPALDNTVITIFRYRNNGSVDNTFNTTGYMTYSLGSNLRTDLISLKVKTDTNNNVVCIAVDINTNNVGNLLLFRVTNSGVLDTTFNSPEGFVLTDFGSGKQTIGFNIYIDSNHSILVSGVISSRQEDTNLVTARYYGLPPTTTTLPPTTTTTTTLPPTTLPPISYITVRFAINADYYKTIFDKQSLSKYESALLDAIVQYTNAPRNSINIISITPGSIVNEIKLPAEYVASLQYVIQNGLFYITINGVRYQAIASSFIIVDNICFQKGTIILTPYGYRAIENLKVDDLVQTTQGRIVKIQKVNSFVGKRNKCPLYLIQKGSLGPNVPLMDLYMSDGHAYRYKGHWCHMKCSSVSMELDVDNIEYYNISVDNYFENTLVANGLEVESLFNMNGIQMSWNCSKDNCKPVITVKNI